MNVKEEMKGKKQVKEEMKGTKKQVKEEMNELPI